MGWMSRIEQPWVSRPGIALWRLFSDLDLSDAKHTRFKSLHDCFTRELKDGARPIETDPDVLVEPLRCDRGRLRQRCRGPTVLQAKGFPYPLMDLLGDADAGRYYRGGQFATLRLTSSMYHRFHAPLRLPRRTGQLHLRRHLERESHRAAARRAAVLQE